LSEKHLQNQKNSFSFFWWRIDSGLGISLQFNYAEEKGLTRLKKPKPSFRVVTLNSVNAYRIVERNVLTFQRRNVICFI
jgi:hypothetical protein